MTSSPIRLELFKFSRKPTWIILAVFLAILLKGAVFLAARFEPFGGGIENGYAFLARSARYSFFLGSFLLCLMAGATLSGEYASGILRMHLSRPVSRSAYFLQRSLFLVFVAFLLILLDGTVGTLVGWGGFGFFDVADTQLQGPQFGAAAMAWSSLEVYLLSFLGMAALASLGLLVSVILRTPVAAIGTAAGLFFFMQGVQHIFRDPARSFMATFYIQDHVNHLAQRAQGIAEYQPPDYLFKAILVPLAYIILTNAIGLILFKRMDVLD
jgi:ABC-2 type transport system permease protein